MVKFLLFLNISNIIGWELFYPEEWQILGMAFLSLILPIYCLTGFTTKLLRTQIKKQIEKYALLQQNQNQLVLQEKKDSLSTLAGGIAHDFNNYLTTIMGNLELIKMDDEINNDSQILLEEISKALGGARNLTNQLLAFSKSGIPLQKATNNFKKFLQEVIDFTLHGTEIQPVYHFDELEYIMEFDQAKITQVLQNIILNAKESMETGRTIEIFTKRIKKTEIEQNKKKIGNNPSYISSIAEISLIFEEYLQIIIQDHGVGIPENIMQKIFDPYFSTKKKGHGLGIWMAKSIVSNHNGFIDFYSEIGKGTRVSLYLPFQKKELQNRNLKEQIENQEKMPDKQQKEQQDNQEVNNIVNSGMEQKFYPLYKTNPNQLNILIMDDEIQVQNTLYSMLNKLGHNVDSCNCGEHCINIFREAQKNGKKYDGFILDLTVPGKMGGREALIKLHQIEEEIPAILTTGYNQQVNLNCFKSHGFQEILVKPYTMEELKDKLNVFYRIQ